MQDFIIVCVVGIALSVIYFPIVFGVSSAKKFKDGYEFANGILEESDTIRSALHYLKSRMEASRVFDEWSEFESGAEQAIKERIINVLYFLNELEGGDWMFDEKSYIFKDTLTSRTMKL
tara:strand:- start:116 stop:472 length:357 start_codon:yes stop_codon:yes gene_type:complete